MNRTIRQQQRISWRNGADAAAAAEHMTAAAEKLMQHINRTIRQQQLKWCNGIQQQILIRQTMCPLCCGSLSISDSDVQWTASFLPCPKRDLSLALFSNVTVVGGSLYLFLSLSLYMSSSSTHLRIHTQSQRKHTHTTKQVYLSHLKRVHNICCVSCRI